MHNVVPVYVGSRNISQCVDDDGCGSLIRGGTRA